MVSSASDLTDMLRASCSEAARFTAYSNFSISRQSIISKETEIL